MKSNSVEFASPPQHRLFAIFDNSASAGAAVRYLRTEGLDDDDLWTFSGAEGERLLDPAEKHQGLAGHLWHAVQRVYTNDREYAEDLFEAVRQGGWSLPSKLIRYRRSNLHTIW